MGKNVSIKNLVVQELESFVGHRRVCLVQSEPGCGRSGLAALLALSWTHRDERVTRIGQYKAAIVVSGLALDSRPSEDLIRACLQLSTLTHGVQRIRRWLSESKVLLVVDDAEGLSRERTEELRDLIGMSRALDAVVLSVPSHCDVLEEEWKDLLGTKLSLNGYEREKIVALAEEVLCRRRKVPNPKDLKKYLIKNLCRLDHILKCPQALLQVCDTFVESPDAYRTVTTATDVMWTLTLLQIRKVLGVSYEENDLQTKSRGWMMLAGQRALEALRDNKRLEGDYMEKLESDTKIMFPSPVCQKLIASVFKQRNCHNYCPTDTVGYSCVHSAQQEFLAAWYVAHEIVKGKKLLSLTGELQCAYQLAIFMGGLTPKVSNNGRKLGELDERRLIGAVLNHTDESSEDLNFNLDLVAEVKAAPRLLEYIVEMSEYPDEWNISAADAQLIPIEALLLNVAPTRIFLNVEDLKPYSELGKVVGFLCRVDIYVWLDSSCQFRYGSGAKMDRLIKGFSCEEVQKIDLLNVVTKIDLVAGCMSTSMLRELPSQPAFSHLVYLKLRVLDRNSLALLLVINKYLPRLLWLEAKIDFAILEEEFNDLPQSTVTLMDVHLQGLKDENVARLAHLLGTMHTCYSGIHLENTTLTPEGLFVLLKQLNKRNIRLYSHPEARDRFRRWYYPQLSSCDRSLELTDDRALELLGFDDRMYYSNHYVSSNCYAVAIDAWNLMSYLEEQEDIVHFTFKTENLSFIKRLTGSVDIEVHKENGN